jgi:hypothetical protein
VTGRPDSAFPAEGGEREVDLVDVRAVVDIEQAAERVLLQAEPAGELGPGDAFARGLVRRQWAFSPASSRGTDRRCGGSGRQALLQMRQQAPATA